VGKSCPALSSEPGLILLTARLITGRVVRGSVGLGFVTLVVHPLATFGEQKRCDVQTFQRTDVPTFSHWVQAAISARSSGSSSISHAARALLM